MTESYVIILEPEKEGWSASVPDLPGCFSDGATPEEAEAAIREAIALWVQTAGAKVWPVPQARAQALGVAI